MNSIIDSVTDKSAASQTNPENVTDKIGSSVTPADAPGSGNEAPADGTDSTEPGSAPEQDGPERSRRALIARNRTNPARLEHGLRRRDSEALRVVCHEKTCLANFSTCEHRNSGGACAVADDIKQDCESFVNTLPETCSWIKPKRDSLALGRLSEMLYRKEVASILLNKTSGGLASALCSKATTAARLLQHLRQVESAVDKLVLSLKLNPNSADTVRMRQKIRGRWIDIDGEGESMQMEFMRKAAAARAEADARKNPTGPDEITTHEIETPATWNEE